MPDLPRLANPIRPFVRTVVHEFGDIVWLILLIGVLGGLIGLGYLKALATLTSLLGPVAWPGYLHIAILAAVGALIALLVRLLGDPGDVELLVDNIHVLGGSQDRRRLRSLLPVSLLCIAAGGAAGPEAPLVQTTGMIGTWTAEWRRLPMREKRVLTITGMAAGFTVLFGSPMGAAIFSLEILHRRSLEYYEALLPAVLGSLCGYGVLGAASGLNLAPVWHFPAMAPLRPIDLGWATLAGGVAAAVAAGFTWASLGLRRLFQALPAWARPMAGGLALGALAILSPYALTFGEFQVNTLTVGASPAVPLLLLAAAVKLIGTSVTLASGWRGGFIIPLFFIGVALGRAWHLLAPTSNEVVLLTALMAAINTGVTKTPLGSSIVVAEMTGLRMLPTTLLASMITLLLTSPIGMIETQRSRDAAVENASTDPQAEVA